MYCGNCFRDNALVASLRQAGHSVLMIPVYLPLTLDEEDQSAGVPIFFNGINVYLEQEFKWFRHAPEWIHRLFASRRLLKWAAGKAAKTKASELGEMTISMMLGEQGNQARELDQLIEFLKTQPKPDIICLSNALLIGMARKFKSELNTKVACVLQGEDAFLDGLPETHRALAWRTLSERAREVDLFIPPSQYFASVMGKRLSIPEEKIRVIYNGINLTGYEEVNSAATVPHPAHAPTLGFFARMCREKGLDTLVEAFILLKQRNRIPNLKLKIGGSCGPSDQPLVDELKTRLARAGFLKDTEFHPNVSREEKQAFFRSLTVFSVPAAYSEAFGLYLVEAFASGIPVVQPRHAAFTELVELSGGGVLCEPADPASLAREIENLLLDPAQLAARSQAALKSVRERFNSQQMARETMRVFEETVSNS